MTHTNYAAVNGRGRMICTFDTLERAKSWTKARACEHDGLHVIEIITTQRVAYRPMPKPVQKAA